MFPDFKKFSLLQEHDTIATDHTNIINMEESTKPLFEELIKQIFEQLDFHRIYTVMKTLDWHWHVNEQMYIPSVTALQQFVYDELLDVYNNESSMLSSGGFMFGYDREQQLLWVNFTITEASSH
jgi:hypothetical protein